MAYYTEAIEARNQGMKCRMSDKTGWINPHSKNGDGLLTRAWYAGFRNDLRGWLCVEKECLSGPISDAI